MSKIQESPIVFLQRKARDSMPDDAQWSISAVRMLFELPLNELLLRAQLVHREYHDPNSVQVSTLLSIKTGGCPEDCGYCSQSAHNDTGLKASKLMELDKVLDAASNAKAQGATRFCMGAAWRSPKDRDLKKVMAMVAGVKALGLETCVTLGMLEPEQAGQLKAAGLDYYNHNLDTSREFYGRVATTRSYEDRLDTLRTVRDAGLHVCCGGILGLGEERMDRVGMIAQLAALSPYPESVPINNLARVPGTPLASADPIDQFEIVRTIAAARITMPKAVVRLTAGREEMDDALQALCFFAGANSIFCGDVLLTTKNPGVQRDRALLDRLGLKAAPSLVADMQE